MRLVDQSTRATIRTLTIMAAVTALLLTMFTFAPTNAYAVSLGDWDTTANGPLPYTNFDDPDDNYGPHNPQATVQVVQERANPTCGDLDEMTQGEVKFEVSGGKFVLDGDDDHGIVITNVYEGTVTDGGDIRTWTFVDFVSPDRSVSSVFVKQSTGGVWFNYGAATSNGDHHLHSQDQGGPDSGVDAISHISFCFDEEVPPPAAPTLTIVKQVINDDGGTAEATEFDIRINNGDPLTLGSETAADGFDSQASWTGDVEPGEHTITEDTFAGYTLVGIDCGNGSNMVTLDAGESATCTVINNDNPVAAVNPTVTLVKTVDNTNGGTLDASDFPVFVNDDQVSWGVAITVTPGEHMVSEVQQPGYFAGTWGGDCAADGSLTTVADTDYTCTITNTAGAASLTLVKEVLIGDLDPSAFSLLITDSDGVTQTVSSGQATPLPAGTYTIGEVQQAGYELVDIECDNGAVLADGAETVTLTVGLSEAVECFIINAESVVLGEVVVAPEIVVAPDVVERPVVRVLPAVEQLPATGLDTMRLTLLSVLMAALGALFLLGTSMTPAKGRRRRG